MKPLLTTLIITALSLSWLSLDSGRAAWGIGVIQHVLSPEGSARWAQLEVEDLRRRLDAGEVNALFRVGIFHISKRSGPTDHFGGAIEKEFGPADSVQGLEYMRLAVEGRHPIAGWFYWRRAGWPDRDSLISRVRSGYRMSAFKVITDLANEVCIVNPEALEELREASFALRPDSVRNHKGAEPGAFKVVYPGEEIRTQIDTLEEYRQQNCTSPEE